MVLWEEILALKEASTLSWCIVGDFNIIKNAEYKVWVSFDFILIQNFVDFIDNACLIDLPLLGGKFTWSSNINTFL
ncbi:hypothetical protein CRYUN_Cryun31cG0131100 [Craigia yunnanensis]